MLSVVLVLDVFCLATIWAYAFLVRQPKLTHFFILKGEFHMKLKKALILVAVFALLGVLLASCDTIHIHDYREATCTTPATCTQCGMTEGAPLGHISATPTCTEPAICSRCSMVIEDAIGHNFAKATCTEDAVCTQCHTTIQTAHGHDFMAATCIEPQKCRVCGITQGDSLGHNYSEASCTAPAACTRCNATTGEPEGHQFVAPTCNEASTCSICGTTRGQALGHQFIFANSSTCSSHLTCTRCNEKGNATLSHLWVDATCTTPGYCSRCGNENTPALGHNYTNATCTSPKTCKRCQTTHGSSLGHNYSEATCLTAKTCKTCGATSGDSLGHAYVDGFCIRCNGPDPDLMFENLFVIDSKYYNGLTENLTDTYGNSYDKAFVYYDHFNPVFDNVYIYSIHNLNKKYTSFSGSFVAGNKMSGIAVLQIFVDNELVFSSSNYRKTTGSIDFNINIQDSTQLKICIELDPQISGNINLTMDIALVNPKLTK